MDYPFDQNTKNILDILKINLSEGEKIYMVGGMVRDILMRQQIHDFDFVFKGDVRKYAIKIADSLNAAFFMLNEKHKTARIINRDKCASWRNIDIIQMRGNSIEEDLIQRDITINAIAIDIVNQKKLIDPLSGAMHLHQKILVACSQKSFIDDPVRILRAIRQSTIYHWRIDSKTIGLIKQATSLIPKISPERKRDEIMRILDSPNPLPALNILDHFGLLNALFFEKVSKTTTKQESYDPHTNWEKIKLILKNILLLEKALVNDYHPDNALDLRTGQVVMKLGRFRSYLSEFFENRIHSERSLRSLLLLTIIFTLNEDISIHEKSLDGDYEISFMNFERRIRTMVLTNEEIKIASLLNANKEIIHSMAKQKDEINGGDVYQFFSKLGSAGILLCFYSIAETMSITNQVFPEKYFDSELQLCRTLMTGYFQKHDEWINPIQLVDGHDLMKIINKKDSVYIGEWLDKVRKATAEGILKNKEEAIQYLKNNYSSSLSNK